MKPQFMVTIPLAEFKRLKMYSVGYLQFERGTSFGESAGEIQAIHEWYNREIARVRKLSGRITRPKTPRKKAAPGED